MNSQAARFFSDPAQLKMAHAIEANDTSTIRQMIQKQMVSANGFGTADKEQPISFLTYAVMVKNKKSMHELIANGADPNFKTPDGWSAMAEAVRSPDPSLLPFLLDAGGNANLTGPGGNPITFQACLALRWENLYLLLNRGADINARDGSGEVLLLSMAHLNAYEQMLELLKRGADPTITRGKNKVSVAWAVQERAGRLTPEREVLRQRVIHELEARGVHFPVPKPPSYKWNPAQHKFVLPAK